jgi:hypothetical protein
MFLNGITVTYFRIKFYAILNHIETVYKIYQSVAVYFIFMFEY